MFAAILQVITDHGQQSSCSTVGTSGLFLQGPNAESPVSAKIINCQLSEQTLDQWHFRRLLGMLLSPLRTYVDVNVLQLFLGMLVTDRGSLVAPRARWTKLQRRRSGT